MRPEQREPQVRWASQGLLGLPVIKDHRVLRALPDPRAPMRQHALATIKSSSIRCPIESG